MNIATLMDGSRLFFAQGKFDGWCIYLRRPRARPKPPLDTEYFQDLRSLALRHGPDKVYADFVRLFNCTKARFVAGVAPSIAKRAREAYGLDAALFERTFCLLYAGMVAEENKERTRLGKRIKRLGVHQVLVEGMRPERAAQFSRGMGAPEIDRQCKARGF